MLLNVTASRSSNLLANPLTIDTIDISAKTIGDLILVRTFVQDRITTSKIAADLGISTGVLHPVFEELRQKRYFDVHGLVGDEYSFSLTTEGRSHAQRRMERCSYNGVAPVTLERYREVVDMQKPRLSITKEGVRRAFADLVVSEKMVDQIGPAFATQRSIFFYGPTGNGKTSIAERLVRLYTDAVVVPYAIEVDNQIITVFDPTVHQPLAHQPSGLDPRWVACRRPLVITGGELEASMLQLKRDASTGIYSAPLQMRANNGILMIDDFGRQLIAPDAMLNRWIVPLEKRIDYLALEYGLSFSIPFELLVVFSTNLEPRKLGDDAFFRRIQNKVYIGPMTAAEFDEVALRTAEDMGIDISFGALEFLQDVCLRHGADMLRACYPRDLFRLVKVICEYEGRPITLTADVMERAASLYFTVDGQPMGQIGLKGMAAEERAATEPQRAPAIAGLRLV